MNDTNPNIRKTEEFETFIKLIENGDIRYWNQIADALGVNKDTITEWKKHPKARKAILDGINHALKEMERVGGRDWRMWLEVLKLYGVSPVNKSDITSGGESLFSNLTDDQLNKLIEAKANQIGVTSIASGEGKKD